MTSQLAKSTCSNQWIVITILVLMMTAANVQGEPHEDSEQNDLKTWMQNVGIAGKKLATALAVCQEQEIENIADLEVVYKDNGLDKIGFR